MKLYELTEQFNKLQEFAGDLTNADDRQAFAELYIEISDNFDQKAHNTCCVIKNLQAEADALKVEIDRLTARRKSCETKAESLKSYLEHQMKAIDCTEVKTPLFILKIQKYPLALGVDETSLPDTWWKVERKPDTAKIKEALKAGDKIDGAWLEQTEGLRIR